VLEESRRVPIQKRDWGAVHDSVAQKVEQLEAEQQIALDKRSLPQYFSNIPAKKR
jgi:hypothetical protein